MDKKINIKKILKQMKKYPADEAYLKSLREELVQYIKQTPPVLKTGEASFPIKKPAGLFKFKTMPVALAFGLIILLGGGGTVAASQNSLPGDILYPVKLVSENARLIAVVNSQAKADLRLELAKKRVDEIERVVEKAKSEGKQPAGLSQALSNFNSQLSGISEHASELNMKGDLEKALELNTDLKTAVGVYKVPLERSENNIKNGGKNEIHQAIESANKLKNKANNEIDKINKSESEHAKSQGFEQAASGKINAAQNKIGEIKGFISNKEQQLGADAVADAKDKLKEAKTKLDKAKEEYDGNNYEDAFNEAQEALKNASVSRSLIKLNPGIYRRDKGGNRKEFNQGQNDAPAVKGASMESNATPTENREKSRGERKSED